MTFLFEQAAQQVTDKVYFCGYLTCHVYKLYNLSVRTIHGLVMQLQPEDAHC